VQMSLGTRLINSRVTAPFVHGCVSLYVRQILSSHREVTCDMLTVSSLLKDKGLRCACHRMPVLVVWWCDGQG